MKIFQKYCPKTHLFTKLKQIFIKLKGFHDKLKVFPTRVQLVCEKMSKKACKIFEFIWKRAFLTHKYQKQTLKCKTDLQNELWSRTIFLPKNYLENSHCTRAILVWLGQIWRIAGSTYILSVRYKQIGCFCWGPEVDFHRSTQEISLFWPGVEA